MNKLNFVIQEIEKCANFGKDGIPNAIEAIQRYEIEIFEK